MKYTSIKLLIAVLLFGIYLPKVNATSVFASTFGYNSTNSTNAFQAAIKSANDTIIVDLQSSDWNVGPNTFNNLNNKTIIFQDGVTLKAIPGLYNAIGACLLRFNSCVNINLIGYGAILKMNKSEYAFLNNSEHRMSINLWNCSNVSIKGLIIDESGGDGIYVGGDGLDFCEYIFIEDVQCINHYRQGMSITNVQNMTVSHCKFLNTQGTLPEAGVDVEPYQKTQRIINLKFENCAFEGNGWAGLALALGYMDSTSLPVSIEVTDCYFKNNSLPTNTYAHCEIYLGADNHIPVEGTVLFERCFIDGSQYGALYTRKTSDAYSVKFKDCAFQNVSQQQIQYNEPIFLEVPSYTTQSGYLGGLEFDSVLISYNTNFSFFRVFGWGTLQGIKDITGNFTIVEPNNNPVLYTLVPEIINCNYTFSNQTSLPSTSVALRQIENTAIECNGQNAVFEVERTSSNILYPLGINYLNSGTASLGNDAHLQTNGLVIPANLNHKTISVSARQDDMTELDESLNFTFQNNPLYSVNSGNLLALNISDCTIVNFTNNAKDVFKMYPNPTVDFITIENPSNQVLKIKVFNLLGKELISESITRTETIDTRFLISGSYLVSISIEDSGIYISKVVINK